MQLAGFARHPIVAAIAAATLFALISICAEPAEAAQRLQAAVEVPATSAAGTVTACKRQSERATLGMATTSAARRHRKAVRSRTIRRKCLARLRRAAQRKRTRQPLIRPNAAPLVIGIDGHYSGWEDEMGAREELGAAVTRHMWELDNPVSDEEKQMIAAATQIHTRVHALLGGNELGDAGHFRDFVVAFVRYWGPGGTFWDKHPELDESGYAITSIELGNEPYFGAMSPTEYADTVRPALEAVAALGVPVKVILPAYIYGGGRTTWVDTLYERIPNLNSLFYAFADHPYWYGHDPADPGDGGPFKQIDDLRARMNFHGAGEKPIFLTEYGESTADCGEECVSEAVQAEHLQTMIDAVVTRDDWGIEMLDLFQLRDYGTDSSDREQQFGLLREDGTPKPSYSIVRSAMQQYRG